MNINSFLFKTKHPSWVLFGITSILTAGIGISVLEDGRLATQLFQPQSLQQPSSPQFQPEELSIEYVSNELLVKIKSPQYEKVKKNPKPEDTGLTSLNKLNKEHKVKKFQQIAKPSKKSKNPNHEAFRWYKVTLPWEGEILEELTDIETREPLSPEAFTEGSKESSKEPKIQRLKSVLAKYKKNLDIEAVEPNYIARTLYIPDDTLYLQQWAHQNTQAEAGWDVERGDPGVIIAIIDTGVDYNHEDLADNIWRDPEGNPGKDFVDIDTAAYEAGGWGLLEGEDYTNPDTDNDGNPDPDNDPSDYNGHGTHSAGIAGAIGGNTRGVAGVCHNCKIMPVRAGFSAIHPIYGEKGLLEYDDIHSAINYAVDNGAKVLSMSFGGGISLEIKDALDYAYSQGVILIASAGNSGMTYRNYPAAYDNVIAVVATAIDDTKAYYSTYGSWVDISAPGGDYYKDNMILSTVPTTGGEISDPSGYRFLQGTSMASPYVAGMAGLLLSNNPSFTNEEIRYILIASADDVEGPGFDINSGYGRVNIVKALNIDAVPDIQIILPQDLTNVPISVGSVEVLGTASGPGFSSYTLSYGFGDAPEIWVSINSTAIPVTEGTLGYWQVESLETGLYTLQLVVHNEDEVNFYDTSRIFVFDDEAAFRPISPTFCPQENPYIDNDKVVWIDSREYCYSMLSYYDIYLYDFDTKTERRITDNLSSEMYPVVSGDIIAWEDYSHWWETTSEGERYYTDIHFYDLVTETEQRLEYPDFQKSPSISGNRIVWVDERHIVPNDYNSPGGIILYDIIDHTERRIPDPELYPDFYGLNSPYYDNAIEGGQPVIEGNKIVFTGYKQGAYDTDIYLYDLETDILQNITDDNVYQLNPDISGNKIIFEDWINGTEEPVHPAISVYDLTTNTKRKITTDDAQPRRPSISGERIVWVDYRNRGWREDTSSWDYNTDIYLYDLATGTEHKITDDDPYTIQFQATISKDRVVWNNGWQSYIYELPNFSPPCDSFGDVDSDGYVTNEDGKLILQYEVGQITFSPEQKKRADVNGDRTVNSVDASFILQYANGTRDTFPMCIDSDGDEFVDPIESYIGTDPYDACPDNKKDKAWPPDFNNDRKVNKKDLDLINGELRKCETDSGKGKKAFKPRYDLNTDGCITVQDIILIFKYLGTSCTN